MVDFKLIDAGWDQHFDAALKSGCSEIRIVCPFIKKRTIERVLAVAKPKLIRVITRFNLMDFADGVSDISALRVLLDNNAEIRGIRNLHAKLYLFDKCAVLTSANLTEKALLRNHELGFVSSNDVIMTSCRKYFDKLWMKTSTNLSMGRIDAWDGMVKTLFTTGLRPSKTFGLKDEGIDIGLEEPAITLPTVFDEARQSFVKFFGESHNRADHNRSVIDEIRRSGCHWACTYPNGKRPRQVNNGDIMFMGRMAKSPVDTLIYGRAIAVRHQSGRDDATDSDIQVREWKKKWPHYVRVHHAEFVAGTLSNGVRLSDLMNELTKDAFDVTQKNAIRGRGNTNPRVAYRQQAAVRLSNQGYEWLNAKLEHVFQEYGKLAPTELEQLDWPELEQ